MRDWLRHSALGAVAVVCVALVATPITSGAAASSARSASQNGCVWHPSLNGAPSRSLLAILGILRRPATPADSPPDVVSLFGRPADRIIGRELYVHYLRRAGVFGGVPYYVAAVRFDGCAQASFPGGDSIWFGSSGGGGSGGTAAMIESRGDWMSESGGTGADPGRTLFAGVVPDGVATVTLHYPAGKLGGFSRRSGPALTVTGRVVSNVVVVTVERAGNQATGAVTTTWRAANGTILKTLHGAL